MTRLALFLHLVAAIVWLGGMAFALFALRPVAAAQLAWPARLDRPVRDRYVSTAGVAALSVLAVVAAAVMLTPAQVDAHGAGHTHDDGHATAVGLDGSTPCEKIGPAASPGQVATDAEGHSHRGPTVQ